MRSRMINFSSIDLLYAQMLHGIMTNVNSVLDERADVTIIS